MYIIQIMSICNLLPGGNLGILSWAWWMTISISSDLFYFLFFFHPWTLNPAYDSIGFETYMWHWQVKNSASILVSCHLKKKSLCWLLYYIGNVFKQPSYSYVKVELQVEEKVLEYGRTVPCSAHRILCSPTALGTPWTAVLAFSCKGQSWLGEVMCKTVL